LGALVDGAARPAREARRGQGARRALPGVHRHGDRRDREPLHHRRVRRLLRVGGRLRDGPDLHPCRARSGGRGQSSRRFARCPRTRKPIANPNAAHTTIIRNAGTRTVSTIQSIPTSWVFNNTNTSSSAPSTPNTISLTLSLRPSSCLTSSAMSSPVGALAARPYRLPGPIPRLQLLLDEVADALAHRLVGQRHLRVPRVHHRESSRWQP